MTISPMRLAIPPSISCEYNVRVANSGHSANLARFVQFYNTPQCSARAYFDNTYGQAANGGVPTDISYDAWITWVLENSANKATKVYIGLPGAPSAANDNGNFY